MKIPPVSRRGWLFSDWYPIRISPKINLGGIKGDYKTVKRESVIRCITAFGFKVALPPELRELDYALVQMDLYEDDWQALPRLVEPASGCTCEFTMDGLVPWPVALRMEEAKRVLATCAEGDIRWPKKKRRLSLLEFMGSHPITRSSY